MSTALIAPKTTSPPFTRTAKAGPVRVSAQTVAEREMHRWLTYLGIPFVLASALFGAAIGTGAEWLIGAAFFVGPEFMIAAYIFLMISSESNDEELEAGAA